MKFVELLNNEENRRNKDEQGKFWLFPPLKIDRSDIYHWKCLDNLDDRSLDVYIGLDDLGFEAVNDCLKKFFERYDEYEQEIAGVDEISALACFCSPYIFAVYDNDDSLFGYCLMDYWYDEWRPEGFRGDKSLMYFSFVFADETAGLTNRQISMLLLNRLNNVLAKKEKNVKDIRQDENLSDDDQWDKLEHICASERVDKFDDPRSRKASCGKINFAKAAIYSVKEHNRLGFQSVTGFEGFPIKDVDQGKSVNFGD